MTKLKEISAEIICDSINPHQQRLTTFRLTYPRFIHSELMTHRAFSRNAASSRAIPIQYFLEQVEKNPATPVRWGKNGKGMQDHGAFTGGDELVCELAWDNAAARAIESANELMETGLHKQIVNRVLEPFAWMETLVSTTDLENFFALRVHKDAQPEFQRLSYLMLEKVVEGSVPTPKSWGEWHIPFGDRMPEYIRDNDGTMAADAVYTREVTDADRLKIATARAARLSYMTMDNEIDVNKDFELHDRLASSGHWSPFEHCAQAYSGTGTGNFHGWRQYRQSFPNENRKVDLKQLLAEYRESIRE